MIESLGIFLGFIMVFFAIKDSHMKLRLRKIVFGGYFIFSGFQIIEIITNFESIQIIEIIVSLMSVGLVIALMIMELKNPNWLQDKTTRQNNDKVKIE